MISRYMGYLGKGLGSMGHITLAPHAQVKQLHEGQARQGRASASSGLCERAGDLFFHFSQVGKMTHCQCGARGPCMSSSCSDVVLAFSARYMLFKEQVCIVQSSETPMYGPYVGAFSRVMGLRRVRRPTSLTWGPDVLCAAGGRCGC